MEMILYIRRHRYYLYDLSQHHVCFIFIKIYLIKDFAKYEYLKGELLEDQKLLNLIKRNHRVECIKIQAKILKKQKQMIQCLNSFVAKMSQKIEEIKWKISVLVFKQEVLSPWVSFTSNKKVAEKNRALFPQLRRHLADINSIYLI